MKKKKKKKKNCKTCPSLIYIFWMIVLIFITMFITTFWHTPVGMLNLALYFAHRGRLFEFHKPYLMDVSYQLSPVNFPSESSLAEPCVLKDKGVG